MRIRQIAAFTRPTTRWKGTARRSHPSDSFVPPILYALDPLFSDSLAALGPQNLSPFSALKLSRCSRPSSLGISRRSRLSYFLAALVPWTLLPLPPVRIFRCSRLSFLGLSRRSRPSDSLAALVSRTLLPLSALRICRCSRLSSIQLSRRSRPSDSLAVLTALVPQIFLRLLSLSLPSFSIRGQYWGKYISVQQMGATFLSDYKEEISLALFIYVVWCGCVPVARNPQTRRCIVIKIIS